MAVATGAQGSDAGQGISAATALVAVACLALLATLAIPGQRDTASLNRRTEVQALAAGLRSAAQLGQALGRAQSGATGLVNGYPVAADIARLMTPAETMAFTLSGDTFRHRDAAPGARCGVRYAPPRQPGGEPLLQPLTDGC